MKYLQNVPIHKDDLFFIPAGTIHAIGAGAVSYTHLVLYGRFCAEEHAVW